MRAPLGLAVILAGLGAINASADTLYSDLPPLNPPNGGGYVLGANPTLPNVGYGLPLSSSVPFDLDQVSAFGGLVNLVSNTDNVLTGGSIALDNYASLAEYGSSAACTGSNAAGCTANGYQANVTVNVYSLSGATAIGTNPDQIPFTNTPYGNTLYSGASLTLVASSTTPETIAWTPGTASGPVCEDGQPSFNNGQCGVINIVNFNLNAPLSTLGQSFIYTVSLNNDLAVPGDSPVDSLNFALNSYAAGDPSNPAYVGISDPDTAYYAETCAAPNGSLSPGIGCDASYGGALYADIGWGSIGYGAISFNGASATPEPATFGLIGFGLVGLGFIARKKKNRKV